LLLLFTYVWKYYLLRIYGIKVSSLCGLGIHMVH